VTFNNLVNDDGSNTVGTLIDKAQFQLLLMGAVVASTSTGAQNNWAPGLDGHTLFTWNGASDAAITGLATGTAGQIAMIRNTSTTKVITFAHLSGSSSAANQFTNAVTSAPTPVAAGGWIVYRHTGTNWQLVGHEQGAWITPTFAAGDYTSSSGTWVVDAGDVGTCASLLRAKTLTVRLQINTSDVTGTPVLRRVVPGGFSAAGTDPYTPSRITTGSTPTTGMVVAITTLLHMYASFNGDAFTAGAGRTVEFVKTFEVT
jgi:hypothetical protein